MTTIGSYKDYIFACDEHGDRGWPRGSKKLVFGGFIIKSRKKKKLVSKWNKTKLHLCGSQKCELKWSHFFPSFLRGKVNNPLVSNDPQELREQAKWALSELFSSSEIIPVNTIVHKDKASNYVFEIMGGRKVVDTKTLWNGPLIQFALFLKEHRTKGEIWHDQLGSRREEVHRQAAWEQLQNDPWPVNPENQSILWRIAPRIRFFDSKREPLVQVADFISGVIYAASIGDEEFVISSWDEFFPEGSQTYKLLHVL